MKQKLLLRGFTLVEMMVVIAITAAVGVLLGQMISFTYKSNNFILQQTAAVESARHGIEYTLENLREASYGADGSYPVGNAATSTVTFYGDVDGDGFVEKVRYYVSGGTLYRGLIDPAGSPPSYTGQPEIVSTVATFVVNGTSTPIFQYYDDTGTEIAAPADTSKVSSVRASILVDIDKNRSPSTFTLSGTATLRNLR